MKPSLGQLTLLALTMPSWVGALDPERHLSQYVHDQWTTDDGLPQSSVMALAQTPDGFLWIGTQDGLVRFDGVRFERFDDDALLGSHVLALLTDHEGRLWVGSNDELARLRGSSLDASSIERWTPRNGLPEGAIYALAETPDGAVWIGTHTGLVRRSDDRFERVAMPGGGADAVYSLLADRAGTLWVGTASQGLHRLVNAAGGWQVEAVGPPHASIYKLAQDRLGRLLAATRGQGLLIVDGAKWQHLTKDDGLPSNELTAVEIDSDEGEWIGFADGTVGRRTEGRLDLLGGAQRLTELEIAVLFEDREGGLWIGSDGGGLHRLRAGALVPWGTAEGLADDTTLVALGARDGSLWVGTELGGLSRLVDGRFENLESTPEGRPAAVIALLEDEDGTLWYGTKGAGLCRRTPGKPPRCETVGRGLGSGSVLALLRTSGGRLLAGTPVGLYEQADSGYQPLGPGESLGAAFVISLFEDRSARLWAGTYGAGLWMRSPEAGAPWVTVALPGDFSVSSMLEDETGTIWASTVGGGLLRFRSGEWSVFTRHDGLPDDTIYALLLEGDSFWMTSNRGVIRIRRSELAGPPGSRRLQARLLGRRDGARSNECNGGTQPAIARTTDGHLWFPTLRGLASIHPRGRVASPPPSRVVLTEVTADGRAVKLDVEARIPAGTKRVELRFTSPTLSEPERVRFRYRLEPYDLDWIESEGRRDAVYGHLPPGRYRFVVDSRREESGLSGRPAELAIVVLPRLHQTTPFRVATGVGLLLSAVAVYRWRIRRLEASRRALAKLVDERTEELARVNRQLETVNDELRQLSTTDALTGLANRRRFDEALAAEWKRAARFEEPLALIVADVDSFKAYNDLYGHPTGDACLKRVASVFAEASRRAGEIAARIGGEEFALLLPRTSTEEALAVARGLRLAVETLALPHAASATAPIVTASFGIATRVPRRGDDGAELVAAADRALYRAKQAGRNRAETELH